MIMSNDDEAKAAFREWWLNETPERREHFLRQGKGGYMKSWFWQIDEEFIAEMLAD
jgi:hypothetical protein